MTASTTQLEQAITGGGIRRVNFFNGRLLTGEDLSREQAANELARLRLGRATGDGVASGLEVSVAMASSTKTRPVVSVEPGLALNRRGRALELVSRTDISLSRTQAGSVGPAEVLFKDCAPLQPGTYSAGAGVYLLTIGPAEQGEGRAEVSGLGDEEAACNTAFYVEGVRFHLLRLALPRGILDEPVRLRNRVAHLVFGTGDERRAAFDLNPFGSRAERWGLLDDLRDLRCLDDEQVPLAVVCWTVEDGLRFIDLWAVRRRIVEPRADRRWQPFVSDRRLSETEATFLQFEDQFEDLRARSTDLRTVRAASRFEFLPPAGVLPLAGADGSSGVDARMFFGNQGSIDVAMLDAELVPGLLHESLYHEPIEVGGDERVQLYQIWKGDETLADTQRGPFTLVFAKSTLPYRGTARFRFARWNLSRFAPHVI